LRSDPALCTRVAASVDPRTAARLALTFSRAIQAAGSVDQTSADGGAQAAVPGSRAGVDAPTASQMWKLMVRTAVPFVGFGFFDNMIMLTVGGAIENTIGVAFGLTSLAAAGMGQMVSDASGITLQGTQAEDHGADCGEVGQKASGGVHVLGGNTEVRQG